MQGVAEDTRRTERIREGSCAAPPRILCSRSISSATQLLQKSHLHPPVHTPRLFIYLINQRILFSKALNLYPRICNSVCDQVVTYLPCPVVRQVQVVLVRAAVVGVAGKFYVPVRFLIHNTNKFIKFFE